MMLWKTGQNWQRLQETSSCLCTWCELMCKLTVTICASHYKTKTTIETWPGSPVQSIHCCSDWNVFTHANSLIQGRDFCEVRKYGFLSRTLRYQGDMIKWWQFSFSSFSSHLMDQSEQSYTRLYKQGKISMAFSALNKPIVFSLGFSC